MKMPKHHSVLGPSPVLTLPQLLDEPWSTPDPWHFPDVDKATKAIEEWIPNDKGLLAKAELPLLDEPAWEPEQPGLIEMGSLFGLSGDLWKPPQTTYTHTFSGLGGYIAYTIQTDDEAKQAAKSYLEQIEADGGTLMLPSYQIVGEAGCEIVNFQATIPHGDHFVSPQFLPADVSYTGQVSIGSQPSVLGELAELVPALTTSYKHTPCGCRYASIADGIVHLNDKHSWPREQIADWLDSLDVDLTFTAQSKGD